MRGRRDFRARRCEVAAQKPQISDAAMIESLVFELDAYCVNG